MTRRDYVRIAAALREARERCERVREASGMSDGSTPRGPAFDNSAFGLQIAAESLADALAADNPRFDRDRFDRAIYGEAK